MYDSQLHTIGLTWVAAVEWEEDLCYQWHQTTVLRHDDGSFYAETGAGCSCNGPLDYVESLSDLDGPFTFWELEKYLKDALDGETWNETNRAYAEGQLVEVLWTLRNL